ncbi:MAG: hypothetical protein PHC61_17650, partial [Chitinivibrionales bacterium]|nr:hypothetical protein [Chitinivibrionales bacterium]
KRTGPVVLFLLGVLYFSKIYKVNLYISDSALHPEGMLFFAIGAWGAINNVRLSGFARRTTILLTVSWIALSICKVWLLLKFGETYPYNLLHRFTVILSVICVWRLYDLLPQTVVSACAWKILLPCTFFIYAFHEPAQTIIRTEIVRATAAGPAIYSLCYLLCPIITIVSGLFLAWFLQRNTPRFFALITGGRGKRNQLMPGK